MFGVDAFTDWPFGGNPAMVFLLSGPAGGEWMQRAAAELNQPATAFLHGWIGFATSPGQPGRTQPEGSLPGVSGRAALYLGTQPK